MNVINTTKNSRKKPDDPTDKGKTDGDDTPQDINLSQKDAEAGSPYENTGEEDPGAALECLVMKIYPNY